MRVLDRLKVGAGFLVLAVVAGVVLTTVNKSPGKDNNYVLSVKWKPETLSIQHPVHITVTVDGYPLMRRVRHQSPWGETLTAQDGVTVTLSAVTAHPGVWFLDCVILRNGALVPHGGYDSRNVPGTVRCGA